MISNSKRELEQEKDARIEELSEEICQLTLDNTISNVQVQNLKKELKDMMATPSEMDPNESSLDLHNCSNLSTNLVRQGKALSTGTSSRKWLTTVSKTQNQIFNSERFGTFMEMAVKPNVDYTQATRSFNQFYTRSCLQTQQSKRESVPYPDSQLRPEEYEEVKSVLDNLLFIVEVEYEIESKVALDLSFINIDHHLEGKLNNKVLNYASPSRYSSIQSYRNIATPRKMTNIDEVPSAEIFAVNYSHKVQKLVQNSYYNNVQNYVYCAPKALERILTANNELRDQIEGGGKQLVVELSEMVLNSYNYSLFLTNQW